MTAAETAPPIVRTKAAPSPRWSVERALLLVAAASNALSGALVYTPPFDPVIFVFLGPGVLAAAALAAWPRPWLHLVAGLLLVAPAAFVLLLVGDIDWITNPFQGPWVDVASVVLLTVTLALALPAGVAGFLRARRGRTTPLGLGSPAVAYAIAVLACAAGLGAMAAFAQESAPTPGGGYDFAPDAVVPVVVADDAFPQAPVVVQAGVVTEIVVENRDDGFHTFTYEKGGVTYDHPLPALSTTRFLVRFDEAGSFAVRCIPHAWMAGTIEVQTPP